jgi:hypothetical protein
MGVNGTVVTTYDNAANGGPNDTNHHGLVPG